MPSHMRLQVAVVLAPTNDCRLVTLISRRYCLDMFPIFETKGRRFGVYFAFVNRILSVHSSTIMTEQGFVSGRRSHSLVCRNRLRSHTRCLSSRCYIINKRYSQISLQFLVCCSRFIRYTAGITMRFMLYTQQITGSVHIMIAFEVTVTFFRNVPTGSCSKFLCLDGYDSGLCTLSLVNVVYVIDGFVSRIRSFDHSYFYE